MQAHTPIFKMLEKRSDKYRGFLNIGVGANLDLNNLIVNYFKIVIKKLNRHICTN